jgi:hypothetical protein
VAIVTLRNTPTKLEMVRLVAFDEETERLYQSLLDAG